MKLARASTALLVAFAALLFGAPLAAVMCAGAAACPCPGMTAIDGARCPGPVFTVEMTCCKKAESTATAPASAALVAPPVAATPPTAAAAERLLVALSAAVQAPSGAWLARAEQRHELGLFTLHDVFRI